MTDAASQPSEQARRFETLLDERSAALARRGRDTLHEGAQTPYLVAAVGAERFGMLLSSVAQVLPEKPCTPLPGAPPSIRGIIVQNGVIVSVLDLGDALGVPHSDDAERMAHLILLRSQKLPHAPQVALAVDRVLGVADVVDRELEPTSSVGHPHGLGAEAVSGYAPARSDGESGLSDAFAVIDLPRLLRPFHR